MAYLLSSPSKSDEGNFVKICSLAFFFPSRFHHLSSASIQTFLLEKTRVAYQAPNERNFHIFYQVCVQLVLLNVSEKHWV